MKNIIKKKYPLILIDLSVIILIIRAFYGFCFSDETFYYSITYRLLSGDEPFFTEWYPTQLNSILLMPLVGLYKAAFGNFGVILAFRILYVIICGMCAIFLYRVISYRHRQLTATICALLLIFYAHISIATFSYYMVSVLSAVMLCSCLVHYYELLMSGNDSVKYLIFSGIFAATFVLSMPTMAVTYIVAVLVIFLMLLLRKFKPDSKIKFIANFDTPHVLKGFLYNILGILIIAVPFFIYLLSSVSIRDFINSIPYVLTDEEHITTTLYVTFRIFVTNVTEGFYPYFYIVCLLGLAAIVIRIVRGPGDGSLVTGRKKIANVAEGIVVFLDILMLVAMATKAFPYSGYIQCIMIIGLIPIIILTKKPSHRMIVTFLFTGIAMAYGYTFTSTGAPLYTEAIGLFVMSIGAICMVDDYVSELRTRCANRGNLGSFIVKSSTALFYLVLIMVLVITMYQRLTTVYRDDEIANLTERITEGPGAGIFTSPEHLETYESFIDTINEYCQLEKYPDGNHNNLLISKLAPWGYIVSDMKCASFSSWRSKMDSERLPLYYSQHPERFPDVVLILNDEVGSYETSGDILGDPAPNENELSGELFEYIDSNYTKKSVPCGTLYVK